MICYFYAADYSSGTERPAAQMHLSLRERMSPVEVISVQGTCRFTLRNGTVNAYKVLAVREQEHQWAQERRLMRQNESQLQHVDRAQVDRLMPVMSENSSLPVQLRPQFQVAPRMLEGLVFAKQCVLPILLCPASISRNASTRFCETLLARYDIYVEKKYGVSRVIALNYSAMHSCERVLCVNASCEVGGPERLVIHLNTHTLEMFEGRGCIALVAKQLPVNTREFVV